MEQGPSWEADVAELVKKFFPFVEPEGSVSCSQEFATGPCPEPVESNQRPRTLVFLRESFFSSGF
jgi:hypothetical protein